MGTRSKNTSLFPLGLGILSVATLIIGGTAALAARRNRQGEPSPPPPVDETQRPRSEPRAEPAQEAPSPPGFFDDRSGQRPIRDASVSDADWAAKFQRHRDGFRDGILKVNRELIQLRAQMVLDRADDEAVAKVTGFLEKLSGVVSAVAGGYGAYVQAFVILIKGITFAILNWGTHLVSADQREFTGWRSDCWWFRDIPIYGPEASRFWGELVHFFALREEQQKAMARLIAAYPNGPGPVQVEVTPQGDFDFMFNPSRPGDLSQAERDANRVFGMQVYAPQDVTLLGPRGFDPAKPLSWKVPGERASIYDRVINAEPGNPAAAL